MKVGYARVSTGVQNLDLQLDALKEHGCEEIFTDKISGAKDKRQGLEDALRFVRTGDAIVVWRLDRLGRNMQHLIKIVNDLNDRGISFHSLRTRPVQRDNLCFIFLQLLPNLSVILFRSVQQLVVLLQEPEGA